MKKKNIVPILYLLPAIVFMLIFMYIPIVQNFYNSLDEKAEIQKFNEDQSRYEIVVYPTFEY